MIFLLIETLVWMFEILFVVPTRFISTQHSTLLLNHGQVRSSLWWSFLLDLLARHALRKNKAHGKRKSQSQIPPRCYQGGHGGLSGWHEGDKVAVRLPGSTLRSWFLVVGRSGLESGNVVSKVVYKIERVRVMEEKPCATETHCKQADEMNWFHICE